jgi:hypothetical protein
VTFPRTLDFKDVELNVFLRQLAKFGLELVNFLTLAADHDARTRRANRYRQCLRRALKIDSGNTGAFKTLIQIFAKVKIFFQLIRKIPLVEPRARPCANDA